jgi:hypothetical protein
MPCMERINNRAFDPFNRPFRSHFFCNDEISVKSYGRRVSVRLGRDEDERQRVVSQRGTK